MPIVLNSKLSSAVANATWIDKTIDDSTIGKLELANVDVASGDVVTNPQREINLSRKIIFGETTKIGGDTLSPDSLSLNQEFRVLGSGAPITMNSLPFSAAQVVEDGCVLILVGHNDSNTVTFTHNDIDYGLLLNGSATLKKGYTIVLNYNDELKRYIEATRNF